MGRNLQDIITDFEEKRASFRNYRRVEQVSKSSLLEYQADFIELKADLRPFRKHLAGEAVKRDDKSATAIKFRIANAIHNNTLEGYEESDYSINQAEKLASGTKEYQKFIKQRTFYKESLTNITDLKNDMESLINLTKDMLKYNTW